MVAAVCRAALAAVPQGKLAGMRCVAPVTLPHLMAAALACRPLWTAAASHPLTPADADAITRAVLAGSGAVRYQSSGGRAGGGGGRSRRPPAPTAKWVKPGREGVAGGAGKPSPAGGAGAASSTAAAASSSGSDLSDVDTEGLGDDGTGNIGDVDEFEERAERVALSAAGPRSAGAAFKRPAPAADAGAAGAAAAPTGRAAPSVKPGTRAAASVSPSDRVVFNADIKYPQVRVIDSDGTNLGIMSPRDGMKRARERGLDLVLVQALASGTPVCKIQSAKELVQAKKKEAAEHAKRTKLSQPKEMRFTARITDHDLGIKAAKMIEFLKDMRPVQMLVSLTINAWMQEEPARREVFAKVVRRVGEAGVGYCDPGSIRGEGANLAGMFQPTTAPKSAADIEKTLAKLATPIKPPEDDPRFRSLDVTALAALEGQASLATIEAMLPPPNILAQFRTGKTKRRIAPDDAGDTDVRNRAAALEGEDMDLNITRPRSRHSHKREAVRKKGEKNSLL